MPAVTLTRIGGCRISRFVRLTVIGTVAATLTIPTATRQMPTPAERRIEAADRAVAARPADADAHIQLALAYAARARETADGMYYDRAQAAVEAALRVSPASFEARKAQAWVLLGKHEFARALELARALNKQVPDDLLVYGFLVDAHAELGNYKEAEDACQWMLDLRPGNIPGFTRAAYLRELFGDHDGALELLTKSYERTPPQELEERGWLLSQIGHVLLQSNRPKEAERVLNDALALFPDYHYALGYLARARTALGDHVGAAVLLERRYRRAPHPENLYELARALEAAGRHREAQSAYANFEKSALKESDGWDNANRELVFYYTDVARKPADALKIASLEIARRKDVFTLDVYAWALYANGRVNEAREHIGRALAVGIKDPSVLARAALIDKAR